MRKSTSVATALLAAGAGWMAVRMWNANVGGVRDRVQDSSHRMKMRSQEMLERGEDVWERGRQMGEEMLGRAQGARPGILERGREMLRRMRGVGESEHQRPGYRGEYAPREDYYGRPLGRPVARDSDTFGPRGQY